MSDYLAVGIGGAIGAMTRLLMVRLLPALVYGLPFQIFFVNVIGCLLMGVLAEIMALHGSFPENIRFFLVTGFLGGFTTFSAFALEFGLLFQKDQYISAILYAILSVILSLSSFFIGIKLVRIFF